MEMRLFQFMISLYLILNSLFVRKFIRFQDEGRAVRLVASLDGLIVILLDDFGGGIFTLNHFIML